MGDRGREKDEEERPEKQTGTEIEGERQKKRQTDR